MSHKVKALRPTRRAICATAAAAVSVAFLAPGSSAKDEPSDPVETLRRLTGTTPAESDRVRMAIPHVFPNGYGVPLTLEIDSPMTPADHVTALRVFAPKNPIVEVSAYRFTPDRSEPRISTRIRLAEPQFVLAVAEFNDGTALFAKAWVEVSSNGCG